MTNLKFFDLEDNPLAKLPIADYKDNVIKMSNSEFLELIKKAKNQNWEYFYYDKGLTKLPPELWDLTSLKRLDLQGNKLMKLSPKIGQLTNLTHLYLGGNELTQLPSEIGQLRNLEYLSLCVNHLTSLPSEVGQLTNLEGLNLYDNKLTNLPPEIGNLINLEYLDLGGNNLKELPIELNRLIDTTIMLDDDDLHITFLPDNHLRIGCQEHSVNYWLHNYQRIAARYNINKDTVNRLVDLLMPIAKAITF